MMILVDAELKGRNWNIQEVRLILDKGESLPNVSEVEQVLRRAITNLPQSTTFMKKVRLDDLEDELED